MSKVTKSGHIPDPEFPAGFGTQTALTPQRTALSVSHFGFEVHVSNFKSSFLRAQTIFLLAVFFGAEDTDLKMRFPGVLVPKSSGDRLDHKKMLQGRNSIKKSIRSPFNSHGLIFRSKFLEK